MIRSFIRSYLFSILLILAILLGGMAGFFWKGATPYLKPFGDIFLNLILTIIVPLIFFSVSTAIVRAQKNGKLKKIFSAMVIVFILTSTIAATLAITIVILFPLGNHVTVSLTVTNPPLSTGFLNQLVNIFTVSNFAQLLSHEHMLALIVFSILVGLAASSTKDENHAFIDFLNAGEKICMHVFSMIMLCAPLGFFAYFAVLVNELGPNLVQNYAKISTVYYLFATVYFIFMYTAYAYLAGKTEGIRLFWKNIFLPASTSIATCSSAASIPANIRATKAMRVSSDIVEAVIPLGSMLHKDGSVIGGVFKIAFLFGLFHLKFAGVPTLLTALGVSILVGSVMGAIPSGGMLGELLILTAYGFPSSALIIIAAISIIIDPIATLLNVTGNSISSMLIARWVNGKNWFIHH